MVASSQRRRALEHPTATALMHRHRERISEVLSYVCLWQILLQKSVEGFREQ
jgi:hypothetical protein